VPHISAAFAAAPDTGVTLPRVTHGSKQFRTLIARFCGVVTEFLERGVALSLGQLHGLCLISLALNPKQLTHATWPSRFLGSLSLATRIGVSRVSAVYLISALLLILLDLWKRGLSNLRACNPWGGFESHPLRHHSKTAINFRTLPTSYRKTVQEI
jgi:hypothetical protein